MSLTNAISEIESPTMQGNNNRIGFELSGASGKELIVVDDPSKRPFSVDTNNLKALTAFLTRTGISWYPAGFIGITGGLQNSSAVYIKGKVNLLGSYREDPVEGMLYISLNFDSTYQMAKISGSTNGAGGVSGYPWEGTSQNISGTAGVSVGYQFFKRVIPFIGYNYQKFQTSGKVKQFTSTNGLDAGGEFDLGLVTGSVQIFGLGAEYRPKPRLYFTPLIQYFNMNWGGNKTQDLTGSIRLTYVPI